MNKYVEIVPSYRFVSNAFEVGKAYRIVKKNIGQTYDATFVKFDMSMKIAIFNSGGTDIHVAADEIGNDPYMIQTMIPGIELKDETLKDLPIWKQDPMLDEINGYPHRFRVPDNTQKIGDVVPDPNEITCTTTTEGTHSSITGGTIGGITTYGIVTSNSNSSTGLVYDPNPTSLIDLSGRQSTLTEREEFFTDVPEENKNEEEVQ